jgi:hypothetical protein
MRADGAGPPSARKHWDLTIYGMPYMIDETPAHEHRICCGLSRLIFLELRERRVHVVPRLRVGGEDMISRVKPTRVIQARCINSDDLRGALSVFATSKTRTTLGAKTALMLETHLAVREMIARHTFSKSK